MREGDSSEINRIFCEVLERQTFLFSDPIGIGEFRATGEPYLLSTLSFGGETPGCLSLAAGRPMAREIAANFLGSDADNPSVEANFRDALNEILNVICGNLLTALNGDHSIHDLSIPSLSAITSAQAEELAGRPGCLAFSVEDHQALLLVEFIPVPGRVNGKGPEAAR